MISMDDCKIYSFLICPECGSDKAAKLHVGNTATCTVCGLHFILIHSRKSKIVYASTDKSFTLDDWQWKIFFSLEKEMVVSRWRTFSEKIINRRTDKRPIEEVNKLIAGRWTAHQVAVALKSGFKR